MVPGKSPRRHDSPNNQNYLVTDAYHGSMCNHLTVYRVIYSHPGGQTWLTANYESKISPKRSVNTAIEKIKDIVLCKMITFTFIFAVRDKEGPADPEASRTIYKLILEMCKRIPILSCSIQAKYATTS